MASELCGEFQFVSETNYRQFLEAMGAPAPMIDQVMGALKDERLIIKENEGTWTVGKPGSDRISNFKLNTEWVEDWGRMSSTNFAKMEGNAMVRNIKMNGQDKEMVIKSEPKDGGILMTHICGSTTATRFFKKV